MRKLVSLIVALLLAQVILAQAKADIEFINQTFEQRGEIVFRFPHNGNRELVRELGHIISIDKINDTCVEAYANPQEFEQFKTYGIPYAPVYEYYRQTRALNMATTVAQMANWDRYPTYAVYLQMMQNYANTYPNLCRLVTNGQAVSGRDIVTLVISDNVNVDEDEPEFWWSSTMHGDETTGWYFMLRLIDYLLTNYGTDEQVTRLVNNIEIHITPNTNPDGTFYRSNDGTSMTNGRRYNQNGVDLNRNFPFINGTASQGNQPEITMMTAYADAHNFVMAANGHGGDECLNYPWDENNWTHARRPNADDDWWEYVCWQYANTVHAINSRILTGPSDVSGANGVTKGSEWYSIDGGRQDYMNYYHHCKEITMEWSSTKMLGTENLNTYWNYHRQAILDYTEQVLFGFNGIVTDACTNQPLGGVHVFINNHDTDNTDVYTSNGVGDYHRPIYGGTYSVTFSKEGYTSQTINVTTQIGTATRLDVALIPANTVTPEFTANPTEIFENGNVQFTNTTNGSYVSASWAFEGGNPGSSTDASPSVTYPTHGTYDATLTLVTTDGCTVSTTKENYISVYEPLPPEADFSASDTEISTGNTVTFTDISTNHPTSWSWTFEGGTPATSTEQNPTVTYNEEGTYQVSLTATNQFGSDTETKTAYITVVSVINMSNTDVYACGGTYKDPAGDDNYANSSNYTQTIYPSSESAYVRLTFNEFSLETARYGTCNDKFYIYDGTSTSAPVLVNGVCGTSNPGTVTATNADGALTIRFTSNNNTVSSGWAAEINCYRPEPVATFSTIVSNACTGTITTTNTSQHATSYLWNFGDGTTSAEATPTHSYTTGGTYTITLTATNANGSSTATQEVEINIPEITSTTPANGCGNASLSLNATGTGTLHWYDSETNGNELGTGTSYTANFDETTTIYVESQVSNLQNYSVGIANNSGSNQYTQNQTQGLTFSVSQALTLVSVDVYCSQANQTKTVTIKNSSNTTVYTGDFTLANGNNTLTLNAELQPGTYNITTNARYTYRQTPSFPYTLDNVISITGQYNYMYGTQYYYSFYNWQVQVAGTCTSERVPVTATITESGNIDLGEPIVQCGGTATIDAGEGFTSYLWSNNADTQSIIVEQSGTYTVTATNGECPVTASKVVTINPVPTATISTENVTLTANVTSGTAPYSYSWNNESETASITGSESSEYCVTITDANNCSANVCTNFTIPTFDITIDEIQNGTISGNESTNYGSDYTFTITPNECYEIAEVRVDGSLVSLNANNQYTIENVTSDHTISASFNQISYIITTTAGNGGTINAESTATCGQDFTFTVNADNCYQIENVTVNGVDVNLNGNSYTINNVSANQIINATFSPITYNITANAGNGGTINAAATANCGQDFSFTVNADNCYQIENVIVNGVAINLTGNSYTINNVSADQVINATFAPITYNVTVNAGNGGSINAESTAACGQDFSFSVIADNCYEIEDISVNGVSLNNLSSEVYTINNVSADQTISATFRQISYSITASAGNGGSISDAGTTVVLCGNNKTYTITANEGYMISDVLVNNASVGAVTSYTFSNVSADATIEARFEEIPAGQIVININSDSEGGEVSPTGAQTIEGGSDFSFTVTPDNCYEIGAVTVNGQQITLDENNSYTIENVSEEQYVNVTFNQLSYTITASAGNGGTISDAGESNVLCGDDKTYTITANEGYVISDVVVDGTSMGAISTYTFENVIENGHTIAVSFIESTPGPADCYAVTNLEVSIESYGIALLWTAAENANSYEVYRNGERIATETSTTSIDLDGHEGDTYYIITNCENGTSDPSESITAITTGIAEYEMQISIFPNPAADLLTITSSETIASVEFVSITGQIISHIDVNSETVVYNVENFAPGMYFVRIIGNDGVMRQMKFVKE